MKKVLLALLAAVSLVLISCADPIPEIRIIDSVPNFDYVQEFVNTTSHPVSVKAVVGKIKNDQFITYGTTESVYLYPAQKKEWGFNVNHLKALGSAKDDLLITCEVTHYGSENLVNLDGSTGWFGYEEWDTLWTHYTNTVNFSSLKNYKFTEVFYVYYSYNADGGKTVYPGLKDYYYTELTSDYKLTTDCHENTHVYIPYNPYGPNYQVSLTPFANMNLRKGDKIKVTINGTVFRNSSDTVTESFTPPVEVMIADQCEAADWWKLLSKHTSDTEAEYSIFETPVEFGEEFSEELILDIDEDPVSSIKTDIKLIFKYEIHDLATQMYFRNCTVKVEKL